MTVDHTFATLRVRTNILICLSIFVVYLVWYFKGVGEGQEWLTYAALSAGMPAVAFLLAMLFPTLSSGRAARAVSYTTMLLASCAFLWLYSRHALDKWLLAYLVPVPVGLVMLHYFGAFPRERVQIHDVVAWNALSIVAALSFVSFAPLPPIWLCIVAVGIAAFASSRWPVTLTRPKAIAALGLGCIVSGAFMISRQTQLDFHHYACHAGPSHQAWLGQSLLWDIPSIYGYLSCHFMSWILTPFGFTFANYYAAHAVLYAMWCGLALYIIYAALPGVQSRTIAILFFLAFNAVVDNLDPLMGPLRYGPPTLLLFLYMRPHRAQQFTIAFVAAVSLWWMVDVAAPIAIGWMITTCIVAAARHGLTMRAAASAVKQLLVFTLFSFGVTTLIVWSEWRPGQGFPPLDSYYLASLIRATGQAPIAYAFDPFGTWIAAAFLCLISVVLLGHMVFTRSRHSLLPAFAFSTFHFIGLLARFVSLSYSLYLLSFIVLIIFQLALLARVMYDELKLDAYNTRTYFLVPIAFLCFIVAYNVGFALAESPAPIYGRIHVWSPSTLFERPHEPALLDEVRRLFGDDKPICVMAPHDAKLLMEAQVQNALPLDPFHIGALIPAYYERFFRPALRLLPVGTLIVSTAEVRYGNYALHHFPFLVKEWKELLLQHRVEYVGEVADNHPAPGPVNRPKEPVIYTVRRIVSHATAPAAPAELERHWVAQMEADETLWPAFEQYDLVLRDNGGDPIDIWGRYVEGHQATVYGRAMFAKAMLEDNQHGAAIPLLRRALELAPADSLVLRMLGNALVEDGQCEEGIAHLRRLEQKQHSNFFAGEANRLILMRGLALCGEELELKRLSAEWEEWSGEAHSLVIPQLPRY